MDEDGRRWMVLDGSWVCGMHYIIQSALTVLPHSQVTNQTKKRDLKLTPAAISNTIKHKCIKRHLPTVLMILTWRFLHEFRLGETQGNAAHGAGLQIWFSGDQDGRSIHWDTLGTYSEFNYQGGTSRVARYLCMSDESVNMRHHSKFKTGIALANT